MTFTLNLQNSWFGFLSEMEKTPDVLFASMYADTLFRRATKWQKLLEI